MVQLWLKTTLVETTVALPISPSKTPPDAKKAMCVCHTLFRRVTLVTKTSAGGHSTLHQGVANEEPGVGYCKRTCAGTHLGTFAVPLKKPSKSCFNPTLRLLPGT